MTVRRAAPQDLALVRRLRLQALADSPQAFDATLAEESAFTAEDWRRFIGQGVLFVVDHDGERCGMALGVRHGVDPSARFLVSVWVDPEARGTGAAERLVREVMAWAEADGATRLFLHVGCDNLRARRCYARLGFRSTGHEVMRLRDAAIEVEMERPLGIRLGTR